jgi:hypothetical protein
VIQARACLPAGQQTVLDDLTSSSHLGLSRRPATTLIVPLICACKDAAWWSSLSFQPVILAWEGVA